MAAAAQIILDDYSPLRTVSEAELDREAALYPVARAWMHREAWDMDTRFQGDSLYTAL